MGRDLGPKTYAVIAEERVNYDDDDECMMYDATLEEVCAGSEKGMGQSEGFGWYRSGTRQVFVW